MISFYQQEEKWAHGHIDRIWSDEFKNVDWYVYEFNNDTDQKNWYDYGFPKLWRYEHAINSNSPLYEEFSWCFDWGKKEYGWKDQTVYLYKMVNCNILPMHSDTFGAYMKQFNLKSKENIWRTIIFLEDWQSGHYSEIADKGIVNWQAGDFIWWNNNVKHCGAIIAKNERYTLQITAHS